MARPSSFTPEIGAAICELIAQGKSLRKITAGGAFPTETSVRRWLAAGDSEIGSVELQEFRRQYARARDAQADHYAERVVDDALAAKDAGLGRLRMDALKWAAGKLAPKKYGDKLQHVGGAGDDPPISHKITVELVKPKE